MKKRIVSLILVLVVLLVYFPSYTYAASVNESEQIIELENGCSLVITIREVPSRASGTKTATKNYSYKADNGTVEWKAVLTGTFTYDGTTATCTESSVTTYVYASNWYEVSKTAGKSGNTATGSVTMGRTVLGFTVAKETYNMSLTCSPDGVLS